MMLNTADLPVPEVQEHVKIYMQYEIMEGSTM